MQCERLKTKQKYMVFFSLDWLEAQKGGLFRCANGFVIAIVFQSVPHFESTTIRCHCGFSLIEWNRFEQHIVKCDD